MVGRKLMRELLFISGSRADYNKISYIIKFLSKTNLVTVLLVDMHTDNNFGLTGRYVIDDLKNFSNISVDNFPNKETANSLPYFAWLTSSLFEYIKNHEFSMTFVHGDRLSALASAMASTYNNVPVCQIEAGDISGNIDESIRHSITKFSHKFLVTDEDCKNRVLQLGEREDSIFTVGMTSVFDNSIYEVESNVKKELGENYCICMYHPLCFTTEQKNLQNFKFIINSLKKFDGKILLIHCNNDPGGALIIKEYEKLRSNKQIVFRKNIPPDKFYSLLKNAKFIIGNSSCGICEAPYVGIPTIDIGIRQQGRAENKQLKSLIHVDECSEKLGDIIKNMHSFKFEKTKTNSLNQFEDNLEKIFNQKFFDVDMNKKFITRRFFDE